jgi:uncharacterized protein (TIGR01777 family)
MKNKKIIIAGGTGFIGQGLIKYFGEHNDIIVLTRHPQVNRDRVKYVWWDGETLHGWEKNLEKADLLINLAGKSVNCRYTEKNKQEIFDSRTASTRILGEAINTLEHAPKLWVNAGSATIYRHAQDRPMDEFTGEIQDDFSVQVCKRWEAAINGIDTPHTRKVILRIAITLGADGGVIHPYLNMVKFGLGGYQGNGRQLYSWVHITDVCRMIEWLHEHPEQAGTYNCSAPNPISNRQFMQTLRKAAGQSFGLPATSWMLSIGACLVGTEKELLLKSRWVIPTRALQAGFTFKYAHVQQALENIIAQLPRRRYQLF